jgi:hypothetical protein
MLTQDELKDLAYAVGTQLGRGHRLSLANSYAPGDLESHLKNNLIDILNAGQTIKQELEAAYQRYLMKMKEKGLEPVRSEK